MILNYKFNYYHFQNSFPLVTLNFLENNSYHIQYEELNLDKNYFYTVFKKIANNEWNEKNIQNFILKVCKLNLKEVHYE